MINNSGVSHVLARKFHFSISTLFISYYLIYPPPLFKNLGTYINQLILAAQKKSGGYFEFKDSTHLK